MSLRDRATQFHGGYRIEQRSSEKRSLFLFVYPRAHSGTKYVIRDLTKREPVLEIYVPWSAR